MYHFDYIILNNKLHWKINADKILGHNIKKYNINWKYDCLKFENGSELIWTESEFNIIWKGVGGGGKKLWPKWNLSG